MDGGSLDSLPDCTICAQPVVSGHAPAPLSQFFPLAAKDNGSAGDPAGPEPWSECRSHKQSETHPRENSSDSEGAARTVQTAHPAVGPEEGLDHSGVDAIVLQATNYREIGHQTQDASQCTTDIFPRMGGT